jgi:adenosylmethionine decarboxylase
VSPRITIKEQLLAIIQAHTAEMITGFEGAEKILQIKTVSVKPNDGLRSVSREEWSRILDVAKCSILSECKSENCTSYVLSESSLFVFENICIFKTCGRTLLLLTIPLILDLLKEKGLQLEFLLYSSKDYLFPECQVYPHSSWKESEEYLRSFFPEENRFILGEESGDHVFLFAYSPLFSNPSVGYMEKNVLEDVRWEQGTSDVSSDQGSYILSTPNELSNGSFEEMKEAESASSYHPSYPSSPVAVDQSLMCEGGLESCFLNVMMYHMDEAVAQQFYKTSDAMTARQVTLTSGIGSLYPGSQIDDYLFSPCGYSMNGLTMGGFYTIHITPEAHCSYVSFETNIASSDYVALVEHVLSIFKPKVMVVGAFHAVAFLCYFLFQL